MYVNVCMCTCMCVNVSVCVSVTWRDAQLGKVHTDIFYIHCVYMCTVTCGVVEGMSLLCSYMCVCACVTPADRSLLHNKVSIVRKCANLTMCLSNLVLTGSEVAYRYVWNVGVC